MAATVIRNMVLNWLVLVPLLLFALMMPRLKLGQWIMIVIHPERAMVPDTS